MPDIHQELLIGASAESVFAAVATQEGLRGWWTPGAQAQPKLNSIASFGFGPNYTKQMEITALQSPLLLKWHCIAGAEEWIGTDLSFELLPGTKESLSRNRPELGGQLEQYEGSNEITLLVFQHNNWKAYTPMFAECSFTWGRFLWSLKLYCETGKGLPWPQQHKTNL